MVATTHEILPGRLWLRGRTNHLGQIDREELARRLSLRWVVACCPRPDPGWDTVEGLRYYHWPFPDGKTIPPWIEGRAALIAEVVQDGGGVLLYCNAGRNRSPLMAALVVAEIEGITGTEATEWVRARRPGALANPRFASYLEAA